MFEPVGTRPDFPAIERAVLERWRERDVFARSLEQTRGGKLFRFYEGPPTANGRPGVHHVEARTFKDVFPRYRTMKGEHVPRKAGWDCHGIPVELEVERSLGFTGKAQIEEYGVEAFNALCRRSVTEYVDVWTELTERIGFWVDFEDAYWTMSTAYVESVWWSLAELFDRGMIYQGHRVVPYCPRCGTALSDHEVAQGYAPAVDPSVYVRLPLRDGPLADEGAALLVWTTTPWTLVSNTTAAVGPAIAYVLAHPAADPEDLLVLAAERVEPVLGEDAEVVRDVALDELLGARYEGPFELVVPQDPTDRWREVIAADYVTTTEGTGVVHLAPAFGAEDYELAVAENFPVLNAVRPDGTFDGRAGPYAGMFVKDADAAITADLEAAGRLYRAETYEHTYPFCWRCKTPLLYYAKPSWYVATTRIRDRLLEENSEIDWRPEHIRDGRMGDWLSNNVDWALSRERYWGTPLPFWRCDGCDHVRAFGSRAALGAAAGTDLAELDPHRPFVDDVTFACTDCDTGTMRRVPEVIDAWYDSGAMPYAQWGYPHVPGSAELLGQRYPADYICEAIDQTRGWFYSLVAEGTLLFDSSSYRRVLCLGHIVDSDGRKMSKSLGNILDPFALVERHGADALRWLLLTDGSPWSSRRVGDAPLAEVTRRFLLTLWNTVAFFTLYASTERWVPAAASAPPVAKRPVMDRWVLAELADTVAVVDAALYDFDATGAGRRLERFVDDLSNWYVRRSRSRFWRTAGSDEAPAAFATLHTCLVELAGLLAPLVPFLADELHERLVRTVDADAPESVHLRAFPQPDAQATDDGLRAAMATARTVVKLGLRARNDAQVAARQPLRRAVVTVPAADREGWGLVADVVADELNVKEVELPNADDTLVDRRLKPQFRALGPSFGARTKEVAAAIEAADAEAVAVALAADGVARLDLGPEEVEVTAAHVEVLEEPRTGWELASEAGVSVALDLEVDDELRREGLARELVRTVNDARKRAGLDVADRIVLGLAAEGEVAAARDAHRQAIAREVLAVEVRDDADGGEQVEVGGAAVGLLVRKVHAA